MKVGKYKRLAKHRKPFYSWVGRKHTEETKRKISEAQKGEKGYWYRRKMTEEHKKKLSEKGKKRKHTDEEKKKISKAHKGKKISKETREKLRQINLGKHHTEESKLKMKGRTGVLSPRWKGGITPLNIKIRNSLEMREWRKKVFQRDGYICVDCGVKGNGNNLNAHHIKSFSSYPKLRFDINNGITLCIPCHKKIHGNK
jgi:hypothetical protein